MFIEPLLLFNCFTSTVYLSDQILYTRQTHKTFPRLISYFITLLFCFYSFDWCSWDKDDFLLLLRVHIYKGENPPFSPPRVLSFVMQIVA
jgi:hypothetical protein